MLMIIMIIMKLILIDFFNSNMGHINTSFLEFLISRGYIPDYNTLISACETDNLEIIKYLVDYGIEYDLEKILSKCTCGPARERRPSPAASGKSAGRGPEAPLPLATASGRPRRAAAPHCPAGSTPTARARRRAGFAGRRRWPPSSASNIR